MDNNGGIITWDKLINKRNINTIKRHKLGDWEERDFVTQEPFIKWITEGIPWNIKKVKEQPLKEVSDEEIDSIFGK